MSKKTLFPLMAGVLFGAILSSNLVAHAAYCGGFCKSKPGLAFDGCDILLDPTDTHAIVTCHYTYTGNIADEFLTEDS